uniref:WD repeat-containing protein 46 n=1 Tax=Plectus sambesii TaxID=2011161 RepID=A0A914XMV2_9BILA
MKSAKPRYFTGGAANETGSVKKVETTRGESTSEGAISAIRPKDEATGAAPSFPQKKRPRSDPADDPFIGDAPISEEKLKKYDMGAKNLRPATAKTKLAQKKFERRKEKMLERCRQAARAEILLSEEQGFLEPENGELTHHVRQREIASAVDISSATKHFDLDLAKFGPYRVDYTRNGRHLLIGGKRGHVAAFDWMTKRLHCETNVMEGVRDVQWLHVETMFAVAQKKWTYIYDNAGVELHCLKQLNDIKRLEFLPYHFLLAAGSNTSYLHWLDVSIGKIVTSFPTKLGPLDVMTQNPSNAIIHCGHPNGVVTLWSPNVKEPLVRMLAHSSGIRGVAVDQTGTYMATTGMDRKLRIWDVRQFKQVHAYKLPSGLSHVTFSQRKVLACAVGNTVQIFKDAHVGLAEAPYLVHQCTGTVTDLRFSPFEDVLGVGHQNGFTSLIVPGAGEPNLDALEANPYQSKRQRREHEVKALLDKIQPELITLEADDIAKVNTEALEAELERKAKVLYLKPEKIDYTPRHRMKGKSSAAKKEHRKQGVFEKHRKVANQERREVEKEFFGQKKAEADKPKSVLDRFKRKDV